MKTQFSQKQLQNPMLNEAEQILRKCVHCGMCLATCPSFLILGDELDSPRGRIYQIKNMLENNSKPTKSITKHMDRCLSCLNCMTTCPSGVDYLHLADHAREKINSHNKRSWKNNIIRKIISTILPNPKLLRTAIIIAKITKPITSKINSILPKTINNLLQLIPENNLNLSNQKSQIYKSQTNSTNLRVALFPGCIQQIIANQAINATIEMLTRHNVEVITANYDACCGALNQHMGNSKKARNQAKKTIDGWSLAVNSNKIHNIIHITAGCGSTVKDYANILKNDEKYNQNAEYIASIARDISEFIYDSIHDPLPKIIPQWNENIPPLRITYHSACSLLHGQKINKQPIELLKNAGFNVQIPKENHLCCGSAGTYNILQGEISQQLQQRKLKHILDTSPDVIVTGNVGCMQQLRKNNSIPILHTIEMLNWASGGQCPDDIQKIIDSKQNK